METRGFVLPSRRLVSTSLAAVLLEAAEQEAAWESVFVSEGVMDPYRAQAPIRDSSLIKELELAVMPLVRSLNPSWRPTRWHFLKSIPGGDQQCPHRDYENSRLSRLTLEEVPGGCILALDKPAMLATYGWNAIKIYKKNEKIVEIPAGSGIFFRGEFIHAGMPYDHVNYRVHCYLDLLDETPIVNVTEIVYYQLFSCFNCATKFHLNDEKKAHQRSCKVFVCKKCTGDLDLPLQFGTVEGLKSHDRRHHN